MATPPDDLRDRLRQQAEHFVGIVRDLEDYLAKEAHTLSEKAAKEARSDIQMLKDMIARWRQ